MENATTILAIYGSVLATIVFLWDIIKHVRDKPCLKVKANHYGLIDPLGVKTHKLGINMVKVGKGMIKVVASGFKSAPPLPDGSMVTVVDYELPKELHQGQDHTSYADPSQIPEDQEVVCGWVRDATGRIWQSKKWPLRLKK